MGLRNQLIGGHLLSFLHQAQCDVKSWSVLAPSLKFSRGKVACVLKPMSMSLVFPKKCWFLEHFKHLQTLSELSIRALQRPKQWFSISSAQAVAMLRGGNLNNEFPKTAGLETGQGTDGKSAASRRGGSWAVERRLIWGIWGSSNGGPFKAGWWFQIWYIFHNIWDNPSHWPIFFKMVKTTNQKVMQNFNWKTDGFEALFFCIYFLGNLHLTQRCHGWKNGCLDLE